MTQLAEPELTTPHATLPEHAHVVVVGAGFGGVCTAHDLLEAGVTDVVVLEAADGPGGTWRHNTYPGAACDVPSHLYSYSFAQNPHWSRVYSPQAEILAYLERCVDDFGVRPLLHTGCAVVRHRFDDSTALWTTELADGRSLTSRFVVRAAGGLHEPSWPEIPGLGDFGGALVHSARWDAGLDVTGARVAIIGSAASAIQILPKVAADAAAVTVYQRTPNYVFPRMDRAYSPEEHAAFDADRSRLQASRDEIFTRLETELYPLFLAGPDVQAQARAAFWAYLTEQVADEALRARLMPDYPVGCKRMLVSDDLYSTLQLPHVELVTDRIAGVDRTGITAGEHREHDVVICATGFDLARHAGSVDVVGPGGRRLADDWDPHPKAWKGTGIPGYPNFFLVGGPNAGVGSLSVVFMIEVDSAWITKAVLHAGSTSLLEPQAEVNEAYNAGLQAALAKTVWAQPCNSWYVTDGHNGALYPGNGASWKASKAELGLDELVVTQHGKPYVPAV